MGDGLEEICSSGGCGRLRSGRGGGLGLWELERRREAGTGAAATVWERGQRERGRFGGNGGGGNKPMVIRLKMSFENELPREPNF